MSFKKLHVVSLIYFLGDYVHYISVIMSVNPHTNFGMAFATPPFIIDKSVRGSTQTQLEHLPFRHRNDAEVRRGTQSTFL